MACHDSWWRRMRRNTALGSEARPTFGPRNNFARSAARGDQRADGRLSNLTPQKQKQIQEESTQPPPLLAQGRRSSGYGGPPRCDRDRRSEPRKQEASVQSQIAFPAQSKESE